MTARAHQVPIDPDAAIPTLVRSLAEDSKRLLGDEVRLAKLETKESIRSASRGLLWMALAFGVGVLTLVAATLMLATLIGDLANDNMWVGAIATGIIELALAAWLVKKGVGALATDAYTLPETRDATRDLAAWARHPQST